MEVWAVSAAILPLLPLPPLGIKLTRQLVRDTGGIRLQLVMVEITMRARGGEVDGVEIILIKS